MKNAKITSASLGLDNDGTFTARIYVRGDSFGGSFGGYVLGAMAESWVTGVLKCAGVDAWGDLTGEMIRVDDLVPGSTIERITHITDDEIYFDAVEWMAGPGAAAARAREANGVKLPRPKLSTPDHDDVSDASSIAHDHLRPDVEVSTKSETIKRLKDQAEASGFFDQEILGALDAGRGQGRLSAARNLAPILSPGQRDQAKELLEISDSDWAEIPGAGAKALSLSGLMDLCWEIAADESVDPTVRAKALDILAGVFSR